MVALDSREPSLSIRIHNDAPETVVELRGKLGGTLFQEHREQVLAVVRPGCRLVLDLSRLSAVSRTWGSPAENRP